MPRRILFYEPDPVRKGDLVHYECGDAWSAGIVVGVRTLRQGMEVLIIGERGIVGALEDARKRWFGPKEDKP